MSQEIANGASCDVFFLQTSHINFFSEHILATSYEFRWISTVSDLTFETLKHEFGRRLKSIAWVCYRCFGFIAAFQNNRSDAETGLDRTGVLRTFFLFISLVLAGKKKREDALPLDPFEGLHRLCMSRCEKSRLQQIHVPTC